MSQVSLPTQYNGKNQPPVGALANALGRLQASRPLRELRETVKGVTKQLPEAIQEATSKIDEYARGMISGSGSTLFEELGLYYIGPIDGHNLDNLLAVLQGESCLSVNRQPRSVSQAILPVRQACAHCTCWSNGPQRLRSTRQATLLHVA